MPSLSVVAVSPGVDRCFEWDGELRVHRARPGRGGPYGVGEAADVLDLAEHHGVGDRDAEHHGSTAAAGPVDDHWCDHYDRRSDGNHHAAAGVTLGRCGSRRCVGTDAARMGDGASAARRRSLCMQSCG